MSLIPITNFAPPYWSLGGARIDQSDPIGALLTPGTYFAEFANFSLGSRGPRQIGVHFIFDAALAATITWQGGSFPDLSIFAPVSTLGWDFETIPPTVTIPGGTAGQHEQHWEGFAAVRARAAIVVTGAGVLRFRSTSKV